MSLTTRLTHSNDAWRLLNGLVCLYKPAGYAGSKLTAMLKYNLAEDLNRMQRTVESEDRRLELDRGGGELVGRSDKAVEVVAGGSNIDYSVHPHVLGPGYEADDIQLTMVNKLAEDVSGVLVMGVNGGIRNAVSLKKSKLLNTFQVRGEWGRATSTGWATGKTRHCATWRHLVGRPWLVDQCLSNVSAGHQARAWTVANCGLETQEAYEQALKGPIKPTLLSETLIYSIKVSEWKLPHFTLEVQCVEGAEDKQEYIVKLLEEIGLKCKTVAHTTGIRCAAVGPFTSRECLLVKHLNLQDVLDNISDNRKLFRETWPSGVKGEKVFRRQQLIGGGEVAAGGTKAFTEIIEE